MDDRLKLAREAVKATLTIQSHTGCNCREEIDAGKWDKGHKVRAVLYAIVKMEAERDALVSAMSGCVGTLSGPQAGNFIITLEFSDWQRRDDALKILTDAKLLSEATHTPAGN